MSKNTHPSIEQITVETIDRAIYYWFDRTMDGHVEYPNGERKKVPVIMASGERFVTSRTNRALRDDKGMLILPMLAVRRSSINPDPSKQALGVQTNGLQYAKKIDTKTRNLQNLNSGRLPSQKISDPVVYEIYTVPWPSPVVMNYEVVIYTQYIVQMNALIEKFFQELDAQRSLVAPFHNHHRHAINGDQKPDGQLMTEGYVVGYVESDLSDKSNFEEFTDQERIVKWSTSITVPATLQLDTEGEHPAIKVERTSFGLDFGGETVHFVDDPAELELIFGKNSK